jgi:hypothetical protein
MTPCVYAVIRMTGATPCVASIRSFYSAVAGPESGSGNRVDSTFTLPRTNMGTPFRRLSLLTAVLALLGACAERTDTAATDTMQPATAPGGEGAGKTSVSKEARIEAISPGAKSLENVVSRGQAANGSLETTDAQLTDGSHYDIWYYDGAAGQNITVHQVSTEFDTYLGLARLVGDQIEFLAEDDDSGEGLNAQLSFTLPAAGTYFIVANSYVPGATGAYTLRTDVQ